MSGIEMKSVRPLPENGSYENPAYVDSEQAHAVCKYGI